MQYHIWNLVNEENKGELTHRTYECSECQTKKSTKENKNIGIERRIRYTLVHPTCPERRGISFSHSDTFKKLDSREQLNTLVNSIENETARILVKLIYMLGSRIGETVQIKKKDFKNVQNTLMIYREIFKRKNRPYEATWVPLEDSFVREILVYIKELNEEDYIFPAKKVVFGYTYQVNHDRHISIRHARRLINRTTKKYPHYFRHLRLTHVAIHMKGLTQLRAYSHHDSETALSKYVHLMPSMYSDNIPIHKSKSLL